MTNIEFISTLLVKEQTPPEEYFYLLSILKDLELLEKYKRVMCEPILDIMKKLEILEHIEAVKKKWDNGEIGYINFAEEAIEVLENANNL